jgi:methanogenic corrinoid protein MtbC1
MVFIRVKKVKGLDYYYLVKSQWVSSRKTSIQRTIKYLGKASDITIDCIPEEYRNDVKVVSLLESISKDNRNNNPNNEELVRKVIELLKNGEIEPILKIAKEYENKASLAEFYDKILKPVMYEIGTQWENNELGIGVEHVCSNIAIKTIHKLSDSTRHSEKNEKIVISTPDGELHNIACNIIESILLEKGYKVSNISPSVPTESIVKEVKEINPSIILLSVALQDNIRSAIRLVRKLGENFQIPILLGGFAINNCNPNEIKEIEQVCPLLKVISNSTLESVVRIIKQSIKEYENKHNLHYERELTI